MQSWSVGGLQQSSGHARAETEKTCRAASRAGRLYAIGRNADTIALASALPLQGVVDDFALEGESWKGLPIIGGGALPRDALVVNCAALWKPVSAARRIETLTGCQPKSYVDVAEALGLPLPDFVQETRNLFAESPNFFDRLLGVFADAESRRTLKAVFSYRLTGDWAHMADYTARVEQQYFDAIYRLAAGAIFIDAGGYDGATTKQFFKYFPDACGSVIYEPIPAHLELLKRNFADEQASRVTIKALALADASRRLRFDGGSSTASRECPDGDLDVEATSLDVDFHGVPSLVKMDLEGGELNALRGAVWHIEKSAPVLTIAAYHRATDLQDILALVRSVRDDYEIYLRHYTEGWTETVVYFVPSALVVGS